MEKILNVLTSKWEQKEIDFSGFVTDIEECCTLTKAYWKAQGSTDKNDFLRLLATLFKLIQTRVGKENFMALVSEVTGVEQGVAPNGLSKETFEAA